MPDNPDSRLILHVKGSENQTAALPKKVVRAAISQGQLTHSQLIWSAPDNSWKQVREMPELLPSQKLAPAPPPRAQTSPIPQVARQTGAIPRVAVSADGTPKVNVAKSVVVKEADGAHPLKWLCIGLSVLIVVLLGVNYFMVDEPLVSRLGATPYANIPVYAHLGAYLQPNVVVIHIPRSSELNRDNLTSFLVALAHSTPTSPLSDNVYERIALTSGWQGQYTFSGYDWKQLGDMGKEDSAHQEEFIMNQMTDASGQPLLAASTLNENAQTARREEVWTTFVTKFAAGQAKSGPAVPSGDDSPSQ